VDTNWNDWEKTQQSIYEKCSAGQQTACTDGLCVDPTIQNKVGGYLVILTPALSIRMMLARIASEISAYVPGTLTYTTEQLHTTISDYLVTPHYKPGGTDDRDHILEQLHTAIDWWISDWRPTCMYHAGVTFNQTTVIAQGYANKDFFTGAHHLVQDASRRLHSQLRMPWGSHITMARFGTVQSAQDARRVQEICTDYNAVLKGFDAYHPCVSIAVGYFTITQEQFNLTITKERVFT
jgi:hypothetical protein